MTLVSVRGGDLHFHPSALFLMCVCAALGVCVCCAGSAFLRTGFLYFLGAGVTLQPQCEGFPGCGAQALRTQVSVVVDSQALEHRLCRCGTQA